MKIKINNAKKEQFNKAAEIVIEAGMDIWFTNGQTKLYIPIKGDSYTNICLNIDGTWELE